MRYILEMLGEGLEIIEPVLKDFVETLRPRVTTVCGSLIIDRSMSTGFGVVVMTACGLFPRRSPNCSMSQVS